MDQVILGCELFAFFIISILKALFQSFFLNIFFCKLQPDLSVLGLSKLALYPVVTQLRVVIWSFTNMHVLQHTAEWFH